MSDVTLSAVNGCRCGGVTTTSDVTLSAANGCRCGGVTTMSDVTLNTPALMAVVYFVPYNEPVRAFA